MAKPCKINEQQFEDCVRHLLFNKSMERVNPEEDTYEPTQEELEQVCRFDSTLPKQDGILMKGQIILFGTNHPLQRGDCSAQESCHYRIELERVCRTHKIQFIAEEMLKEVLGQKNTIAWEVAKILKLKHEYVDLTSEERRMLKIEQTDLVEATMYFGKSEDGSQLRDTLTKYLSHPIRECSWYARILDFIRRYDSPSLLFVYGAHHSDAMHNLIKSTGMKVVVAHYDYPQE